MIERTLKQRFKDDLSGMKFGRLKVISIEKIDSKKRAYWLCLCDCGKNKEVRRDSLLTGKVKSCGCLNREAIRKVKGPVEIRAVKNIFNKYKWGAEKRGIEFNLTLEDIPKFINKPCFYCGRQSSNIYTREKIEDQYFYNGIDRVDNTRGYSLDNCVPCCIQCNIGKHKKTTDEFFLWVKSIYEYNKLDDIG